MNIPFPGLVETVFPMKSKWAQAARRQMAAGRTRPVGGSAQPDLLMVCLFLRWLVLALGFGEVKVPLLGMCPVLCRCLPWAHPTWPPVGLPWVHPVLCRCLPQAHPVWHLVGLALGGVLEPRTGEYPRVGHPGMWGHHGTSPSALPS